MDLNIKIEEIKTKKDFIIFLKELKENYNSNKGSWENDNLSDFLEALEAYSEDVDGFYNNTDIPFDKDNPTWGNFAQLLLGAKVYE